MGVVAVALGRASRTAATMSGRSFLVSESDPRCLLGTGMVFAEVILGILLFPFCLDEFTVEVVVGLGLARVDGLLSPGALIFAFHLIVTGLTRHAVLRMCDCSYWCSLQLHSIYNNCVAS